MTSLLLIAAPGLDWPDFDALTRGGALPRLAALRARGQAGWLTGAPPGDGPAALATLVTGRQPQDHGVWRAQEAWPGGLRPVSRASWRSTPLWARLGAAGVDSGVVCWPGARRGVDWPALCIDEDFATASSRDAADWALPLDCVPDDLRETLRARRTHPADITAAMLAPLVPDLARIDQSRDAMLPQLAMAMARAATIQSAGQWLIAERAAAAVFVAQPWLAQVRAICDARRHGPFAQAVPGAWRLLDSLIGAMAAAAGPDALVMVVSPGWRGRSGVVLAAGPGLAADPAFEGGGVLDIAPTALAAFGLADATLPGRVASILNPPGAVSPAPPEAPPPPSAPPWSDPAARRALRAAGYRRPRWAPPAWRAQGLADLAAMLLDRGDAAVAVRCADADLAETPGHAPALVAKARAHFALGEPAPLPAIADALLAVLPDSGWGALAWGAHHVLSDRVAEAAVWLTRAEQDRNPALLFALAVVWLSGRRPANAHRLFARVVEVEPTNVAAQIGLAMAALGRRDLSEAQAALERARALDPGRPAIALQIARLHARAGRRAEADIEAARALRLGAGRAHAEAARRGRTFAG